MEEKIMCFGCCEEEIVGSNYGFVCVWLCPIGEKCWRGCDERMDRIWCEEQMYKWRGFGEWEDGGGWPI